MKRFPFAADVRAVVFDLGNTLMGIDHAKLAATLTAAGVATDEETARRAEARTRPKIDAVLATAARREGPEILAAFMGIFMDEVRAGLSRDDAVRVALAVCWPTLWGRVAADVRPTLDRLRARGYRLAVVSNTMDGRARERIAGASLLTALEFVVDSHEMGIEKPDPRIFAYAASRLALAPSACLYVGDLFSVDVVGARGAGMHAALIDPMDVWGHVDAERVASISELAARL